MPWRRSRNPVRKRGKRRPADCRGASAPAAEKPDDHRLYPAEETSSYLLFILQKAGWRTDIIAVAARDKAMQGYCGLGKLLKPALNARVSWGVARLGLPATVHEKVTGAPGPENRG
jgi:hypothetical protein